MNCAGPCLAHCSKTETSVRRDKAVTALAYVSLGYVIACAVYMVVTRVTLGTPFLDSLTARQRTLLSQSKARRRRAFFLGVGVAALFLYCARPLRA